MKKISIVICASIIIAGLLFYSVGYFGDRNFSALPDTLPLATANIMIEGGSGADVMMAGSGTDLLYADSYVEMTTFVNDGETATGVSDKGDLISGGTGSDFVYGSNTKDLLVGGDSNAKFKWALAA